ncbi:MAG TPA: hypothetical protein VNN73_08730 [Blastocatellia bacterium]|nr:hypothetical protein [Blastocatellia bacterium]
MFSLSERCRRRFILGKTAILVFLLAPLLAPSISLATLQDKEKDKKKQEEINRKDDGKVPTEKELEKSRKQQEKAGEAKPNQAEAIVEIAIIAYFGYSGRKQIETVRGATEEEGTIRLATDQGDITGNYRVRTMKKEKSWQDLMRVDLELTPPEAAQRQGSPTINYVIAFNGATVWSAQNGQYVTPRPEAEAAFRAQLSREYMSLLRYKEDGSKLEYVGQETVVGVPTHVIDMTNPNGEKTRYWVSSRTYRIVHCEYQLQLVDGQPPIKYRISYFYTPFKVVQNTLLPVRRVMEQDGKFVQEIVINNAVYSAKLDPEIFQHLQQ